MRSSAAARHDEDAIRGALASDDSERALPSDEEPPWPESEPLADRVRLLHGKDAAFSMARLGCYLTIALLGVIVLTVCLYTLVLRLGL